MWWLPLIKGIVAVVVGIIAMAMPRATITALVVLLGVYVLVDAVISVANGAAMRGVAGSRLMVVWGVLGGIIAIIMLAHPQAVMNLIVVLVGAWALVSGIFVIAISILLIPITERAWDLGSGLRCGGIRRGDRGSRSPQFRCGGHELDPRVGSTRLRREPHRARSGDPQGELTGVVLVECCSSRSAGPYGCRG